MLSIMSEKIFKVPDLLLPEQPPTMPYSTIGSLWYSSTKTLECIERCDAATSNGTYRYCTGTPYILLGSYIHVANSPGTHVEHD